MCKLGALWVCAVTESDAAACAAGVDLGQLFTPSSPQSNPPAAKNKAPLGSRRGPVEMGEQATFVGEFKQTGIPCTVTPEIRHLLGAQR